MPRLNQDRQKRLEPKRIESCFNELKSLGLNPEIIDKEIRFQFRWHTVRFFPYSGWFSGKSVRDGRGFENLLKQIKNQ